MRYLRIMQINLNLHLTKKLGENLAHNAQEQYAMDILDEKVARLIAGRLKRNRKTMTLIAPTDRRHILSLVLQDPRLAGISSTQEAQRSLKRWLLHVFDEAIIMTMHFQQSDGYERCWQKLLVVRDIVKERNIQPDDLVSFAQAYDEITRRCFTKLEYLAEVDSGLGERATFEHIRRRIVQPSVEALIAIYGETIRLELERITETNLLSKAEARLEKIQALSHAYFHKEALRIYGA